MKAMGFNLHSEAQAQPHVGAVIDVDLNHHLGSHTGSKESHASATDSGELLDLLLNGPSQSVCGQHC